MSEFDDDTQGKVGTGVRILVPLTPTKKSSPKTPPDPGPPGGYRTDQTGGEPRAITSTVVLRNPQARQSGVGVEAIARDVTSAPGREAPGADGAGRAVAGPDETSAQRTARPAHGRDRIGEAIGDEHTSLANLSKPLPFASDDWSIGEREAQDEADRIDAATVQRIMDEAKTLLLKSRGGRPSETASDETVAQYEAIAARLDRAGWTLDLPWEDGIEYVPPLVLLLQHAGNRRTFNLYRAALAYRQRLRLARWLHALRAEQARGGNDRLAAANLRRATLDLDYLDTEREEFLRAHHGADAQTVPAKSKRSQNRLLPVGWTERFLEVVRQNPTYRCASVVLRCCGLRPRELATGVDVVEVGDSLRMTIRGAKVGPTAGQPWRWFEVKSVRLPSWFVEEIRRSGGLLRITAKPGAMKSYLRRLTPSVLGDITDPRTGKKVLLSAITFRHSAITEMRQAGWSHEEIAPAVGHVAADTGRRNYGDHAARGRRGHTATATVLVEKGTVGASRPVKPVDRSRLPEQLARKARAQVRRPGPA